MSTENEVDYRPIFVGVGLHRISVKYVLLSDYHITVHTGYKYLFVVLWYNRIIDLIVGVILFFLLFILVMEPGSVLWASSYERLKDSQSVGR